MRRNIKIRTLSNWSIFITVFLVALSSLTSFFGFRKYAALRSATQDYIACEVCDSIRGNMTANAFAEDVQAALDAGMNAHLAKPIVIDTVTKVIAQNLHRENL